MKHHDQKASWRRKGYLTYTSISLCLSVNEVRGDSDTINSLVEFKNEDSEQNYCTYCSSVIYVKLLHRLITNIFVLEEHEERATEQCDT